MKTNNINAVLLPIPGMLFNNVNDSKGLILAILKKKSSEFFISTEERESSFSFLKLVNILLDISNLIINFLINPIQINFLKYFHHFNIFIILY